MFVSLLACLIVWFCFALLRFALVIVSVLFHCDITYNSNSLSNYNTLILSTHFHCNPDSNLQWPHIDGIKLMVVSLYPQCDINRQIRQHNQVSYDCLLLSIQLGFRFNFVIVSADSIYLSISLSLSLYPSFYLSLVYSNLASNWFDSPLVCSLDFIIINRLRCDDSAIEIFPS